MTTISATLEERYKVFNFLKKWDNADKAFITSGMMKEPEPADLELIAKYLDLCPAKTALILAELTEKGTVKPYKNGWRFSV